MTHCRRCFALFLTLALCFSAFPAYSFAESNSAASAAASVGYSEAEETMIASMISAFLKNKNADLTLYAVWKPIYSAVLRIPSDVRVIGDEAFADIAAEEIFVPAGVESIRQRAFASCGQLKVIHFENGNITAAEDFLSGCGSKLVIDAPEGSTIKENESVYRAYLSD